MPNRTGNEEEKGRPETFDFLGFTHISGKNRNGYFTVKRKTIRKRMRGKLQQIKQQLRKRMHDPVAQTGEWLKSVVQGYFNYHAVPGNIDSLTTYFASGDSTLATDLLRRSQNARLTGRECMPLDGTLASCTARAPSLSRASLRRHSSKIRAVCANERPYGSVRGVSGNRYPYRDRRRTSKNKQLERL